MKRRYSYRCAAGVLVLLLIFVGNTVRVYGAEDFSYNEGIFSAELEENIEFSQDEDVQADIFTDGQEKEEENMPVLPVQPGGYSSYGGSGTTRETVIRKPQLFFVQQVLTIPLWKRREKFLLLLRL